MFLIIKDKIKWSEELENWSLSTQHLYRSFLISFLKVKIGLDLCLLYPQKQFPRIHFSRFNYIISDVQTIVIMDLSSFCQTDLISALSQLRIIDAKVPQNLQYSK